MRILIWIGCMVIPAIIDTVCKANGVLLGAIPYMAMYAGAGALASWLCHLWGKTHI